MAEKKYIFENGVMKINPAYKAEQAKQGNPSTVDSSAIAVVSSTSDITEASETQQKATGEPMHLSESTTSSMEILQDEEFLDKFQSPKPIDGGVLLDKLTNIFAKYEVPIGLINKLLALESYRLNYIIDDSGSMSMTTDALASQATPYILQRRGGNTTTPMTRWEEAEDRLHIMIDLLAYIPTNNISISFLNRSNKISLDHKGKTPEQFADDAHKQVMAVFNRGPDGGTPIMQSLKQAFNQTAGPTMHYLFTDGVPSDATPKEVQDLVLHRRNPQDNPLTFMSCTDQDDETEWMKQIEEEAPFTSELDDFNDEKAEVLHDQGPAFPFSKGFWLLCQLVAAINPDDLDAMDESLPFTKYTLDALMGRKTTEAEFKYYWDTHPTAKNYNQYYQRFATENVVARKIIPQHAMQPANQMPGAMYGQGAAGFPQAPAPSYSGFPQAPAPSYAGFAQSGGPGFWNNGQSANANPVVQPQPMQNPSYRY